MTALDQAIAEQRARLQRIEDTATRQIAKAYASVAARLAYDLKALTEQIENAERAGTEIRPSWLFGQERYRRLISQLRDHTDAFLVKATGAVTTAQRDAVQAAVEDGRRLARAALQPAPASAIARVTAHFDVLPTRSLDYLIGRASDRGPLGALLNEIAPLAPERVQNVLAYGVAAGKNPRVIAREVQSTALVTRHRALVIARTEIVGAHREGVSETWKQSGVVQSWTWQCARDKRTCAACWAQDGSVHKVDESLASHPQCRCTKIPQTVSWAELGFPDLDKPTVPRQTGPEAFARLTDTDKLAILGRAKLDACNAGDITLEDLVHRTHSDRWGDGAREASLAEALRNAAVRKALS